MKAHMIDAVVVAGSEIFPPRCHIHRTMACQGPYTGIMLATQEDLMALSVVEMVSLNGEGGTR